MAASVKQLSTFIAIACVIGLALSLNSYYLAITLEEDDEYEAWCDISGYSSCTKVLQSEYSSGFGLIAPYLGNDSFLNVSNGIFGLLFYTIELILGFSTSSLTVKAQAVLLFLSNAVLAWLAYVLLFEIQELCIICIGLYFTNVIITVLTIVRFRRLQQAKPKPSSGTKKKAPAKKGRSKKD
ncbi:vitamin K epoxide reductase complex subunit 1-like [Contarinia nasturtii]|uniref:vitamin K epoxide reductase complex subunit 1-like n=1 Tax=Contarinia nasturtii TaxID=265458 RepID=UPI0012D424E7|nr:vitamin K epoxide reductase complex subunit 1-like [Contarinia nasturtii]XP_031629451.1 vitamin K epoxide reductase complex subunit 1-like [Contarinia nasturtii]